MALNISPVHRNLHTRVTFLYLEFEDWFVVIGLAALTNIFGRWVDRNIFGIGTIALLVLLDSPLGCPPTMGCPERKASDCSWNTFMQPTSERVCGGAR